MTRPKGRTASLGCATALTLTWVAGCHQEEKRVVPFSIPNPVMGPITIAVAPAINLSGSSDFDRDRFADVMAGELSYADRISVIPVSRVLGALSTQGRAGVESPEHALELARVLGADAILVFAVTEYDPYDPPRIGISAQLYGTRPGKGFGAADPDAHPGPAGHTASAADGTSRGVLAQTEGVIDAGHAAVVADIQAFARTRNADESPYGWRKFVVSQREYQRYCCFATIRALLNGREGRTVAIENRER